MIAISYPRRFFRALRGLGTIAGIMAANYLQAQNKPLLTNASDILSLPPKQASKHLPVRVTGVVTAAEPQWHGQFFVQDSTGGIFVALYSPTHHPEPGDLVEVTGTCRTGAFAPIIYNPKWKKLGTAPLPEAKTPLIEEVMSGSEDSQRIELTGIVRVAEVSSNGLNLDLEIACAGWRFHAFPKLLPGVDPQSLVGATVRVKGTAAASYNPDLRRMMALNLFVPQESDFVVECTEPEDPFQETVMPLITVGRYQRGLRSGQRVHVKGRITYQNPGKDLFLQDYSGSLHVETKQAGNFEVGDVIEAIGFVEVEHYLPVLQDSILRKSDEIWPTLPIKPVTIRNVEDGMCHAAVVTLSGKLLDRFVRHDDPSAGAGPRSRTVLLLQNGNLTFNAETGAPDAMSVFSDIPIDSQLEVTGVCFTEANADGKAESFQILMPDATGVMVLQRPSWWTPPRLITGVGILLIVLIVGAIWVVMISRKNATLKDLVHAKEAAQIELRQAHDQLEERVRERSAQLKLQITARKELELQSKATLAERTRLAQELHDTLEQALIGVALQLDMTARLLDRDLENAKDHLETARTFVAESQTEVHRSVWNLRCRALEEFDLPGAIRMSSRQILSNSPLQVDLKARGRVRPLPEIVEENLLRITQEALTNVIKHAGATKTEIDLNYGFGQVVLQISDNGKGFVLAERAGPRDGHFGLQGISERAKRLQGEITLFTAPDSGTTIRVQIPIPLDSPADEEGWMKVS